MDLDYFFNSNVAEKSNRRPQTIYEIHGYDSYKDVRGNAARNISVAMGIDEESGISNTGYLIELRTAIDHTRISAHAASYGREALVFSDKSVITINLDRVAKTAIQTVYSTSGDIETLQAEWSYEQNGYHGPYERVSLVNDPIATSLQWEKYETLIDQAVRQSCQTIDFKNR